MGTWGAEGLKIYVDGELKGTHPYIGGVPGHTQYAYIAANSWGQYMPGIADEVQIYNYALSDSEIQDLYTSSESGLVASYPFSEGSGTTTVDASGNGHDGTLLNGASWTTDGKLGTALSFDGSDDVVEVADSTLLRLGTTQTIAGWVNLTQLPADWVRVIGKGDLSYRNYGVWLSPSGAVAYQIVSSGGVWVTISSTTQVSPGSWYHFAATYDGTTVRLSINGQEEASEAYTQTPVVSADSLTFGYAGYHGYFYGKLDEVTIYDRALSANEIQVLAGLGGEGLFAANAFSESSAPLSVGVGTLVEVDGFSVYINVRESPDLNYGIGDFTVVVTARTSTSSAEGEFDIGVFKRPRGWKFPECKAAYHTVAGVRQGKDLFLYLDGALQTQKKVGAGRIKRLKVIVGLDDVSTHAIIEDVTLSPYARSPEEIAGLSSESELK